MHCQRRGIQEIFQAERSARPKSLRGARLSSPWISEQVCRVKVRVRRTEVVEVILDE
jgi:hypothetical protein